MGQTAWQVLVVGSANREGIDGHFWMQTLKPVLLSPYHVVGQISMQILSFAVPYAHEILGHEVTQA